MHPMSSDDQPPASPPCQPADPACAPNPDGAPHAQRRGRLRNGNPSGDFLAAPRCGARTRTGSSCRQPAMRCGRCRLHGGKSTGARTAVGRERARRANLRHGFRSEAAIAERKAQVAWGRQVGNWCNLFNLQLRLLDRQSRGFCSSRETAELGRLMQAVLAMAERMVEACPHGAVSSRAPIEPASVRPPVAINATPQAQLPPPAPDTSFGRADPVPALPRLKLAPHHQPPIRHRHPLIAPAGHPHRFLHPASRAPPQAIAPQARSASASLAL